jgi:hypothetical protein
MTQISRHSRQRFATLATRDKVPYRYSGCRELTTSRDTRDTSPFQKQPLSGDTSGLRWPEGTPSSYGAACLTAWGSGRARPGTAPSIALRVRLPRQTRGGVERAQSFTNGVGAARNGARHTPCSDNNLPPAGVGTDAPVFPRVPQLPAQQSHRGLEGRASQAVAAGRWVHDPARRAMPEFMHGTEPEKRVPMTRVSVSARRDLGGAA